MDQQVRLVLRGGAQGQFVLCPVHWVAGLEGDDPPPAELAEASAKFRRRVPE